jgi:hypothetical protein
MKTSTTKTSSPHTEQTERQKARPQVLPWHSLRFTCINQKRLGSQGWGNYRYRAQPLLYDSRRKRSWHTKEGWEETQRKPQLWKYLVVLSSWPSPHLRAASPPWPALAWLGGGGAQCQSLSYPPPIMSFHCFQNNSLLISQVWPPGCFSPLGTCSPKSEGRQERTEFLLEIKDHTFFFFPMGWLVQKGLPQF